MELATLGAGCFWCVEAVFLRLMGVESIVPGYSGGKLPNPTYKEVCTGLTGHAEVVRISFNPEVTSFANVLEVFFKTHDPTTLNRQGSDVGPQYRSVIFFHSPEQERIAHGVKDTLSRAKIWERPIVTEITPFQSFYRAEDYHHNYFANNPNQPYCKAVVRPKVEKFERVFGEHLRGENPVP